jgi:NADH-quinone oxidoreductase subunit E
MAEVNEDSQIIEEFINNNVIDQGLDKTKIIIILQQVQAKFGYLSRSAISAISQKLRIPEVDVYGVATFYEQFRFNRPGDHTIKVCEGTACHVKGGAAITDTIERELGISHGETTADGMFSLERVACLGCCALAPVIVIDEDIHGEMNTSKLSKTVGKYKGDNGDADETDDIDDTNDENEASISSTQEVV